MKVKLSITIIVIAALAMSLSGCFLIPKKLLSPKLLSPVNGATNVSTEVSLQWSDPNSNSNPNNYKIYFGTSTTPSFLAETDEKEIEATDLSYSTTYYWQVAAVNSSGKIATSDVWHFTTLTLPTPSTSVLSVTSVSTDSVSLEWTKSVNASAVDVYSATSTQFGKIVSLSPDATSYMAENLEPSTAYKFFVVALNSSGRATSNTATATTLPLPIPPKPILPSTPVLNVTSVSTDSVSLQWTKSVNASAIDVYSATSTQFNKIASLSANATSYVANNLKPSTTYEFFVVGVNPSGRATSTTVVATTQSLPSSTTTFSIYLTDKPLPLSSVDAVYVNLSDISVHATLKGTATWYSMLSTPTTYNLVDLVGTAVSVATKSLPSSALITQIRLEVASATVVVGTQTFVAKVPSGKIHLNVAAVTISKAGNLFLDFDLSKSLRVLGNGSYQLSPVIHPVSGNMRGEVKGEILLDSKPLANALVSLSTSATVVSETYTKSNGKFNFAAAVIGNYTLTVGASGISTYSTPITVNKGVNDVGTINLTSTPVIYPPVLTVVPLSQKVGEGQTFTFTVTATSVNGIEKIKGDFDTQSTSVNTWTGILTFTSPSTSGDYTATFTAYDNSANHNQTIVTAAVDVNTSLPTIKFISIPATVGSGIPFTVSVEATAIGTGNAITSMIIGGTPAIFTSVSSNTYSSTVTLKRIENGSTTIAATALDDYGNVGSVSKSIYVDGTPPMITVKLPENTVYFVSSTKEYSSSTTGVATIELYYGTSTPTIVGTVTDDSGTNITVSVQYDSNPATTSTTPSTTFSIPLKSGSNDLAIEATDVVLNVNDSTITFVATRDVASPTVTIKASADTSSASLNVNSTFATVTYTAYDNGSGLMNDEAALTIASTYNVTIPSSTLTSTSASKTIDVMNLLLSPNLSLKGKAGVATATIAATDNVGNATTTSDRIYFDFRFLVATATRVPSGSGSAVVITFSTDATTVTAFSSNDLYLVSTSPAATYYVYQAVLPNGSRFATITAFATDVTSSTTASNTAIAASNLANGAYNLYVLNGIVGATTTTQDATVANVPYTVNVP